MYVCPNGIGFPGAMVRNLVQKNAMEEGPDGSSLSKIVCEKLILVRAEGYMITWLEI